MYLRHFWKWQIMGGGGQIWPISYIVLCTYKRKLGYDYRNLQSAKCNLNWKEEKYKKKTLIVKIEIKIKMDDNEHSFIN